MKYYVLFAFLSYVQSFLILFFCCQFKLVCLELGSLVLCDYYIIICISIYIYIYNIY